MSKTALIIVDLQFDFVEGTLAVPGAHDVVEPIADAVSLADEVVLTRDWHPADHCSFSDDPQFVDKSWPAHCVEGTEGAMIHPYISRLVEGCPVFSKGTNPEVEAYSGFQGGHEGRGLDEYLGDQGVGIVYVAGLATDYCVKATVNDACDLGYSVCVLADAVRGVHPTTTALAIATMCDYGAAFSTVETVRQVGF